MSNFKKIHYPKSFEYSSDTLNVPMEFYLNVLPRSRVIYLKLGYFSSKALELLSYGFAQFIYHGGEINIISNHFLYERDQELLNNSEEHGLDVTLINDLNKLKLEMTQSSQHFFNCLKLLTRLGKLKLVPVKLKPARMVHFKQGLFLDDKGNALFVDGSCNFTANGLVGNAETLTVFRSWGSEYEKNKIKGKLEEFDEIVSKEDARYEYLSLEQIENAVLSIGQDKDIENLLKDEKNLLESCDLDLDFKKIRSLVGSSKDELEEMIVVVGNTPRFPFLEGPREYQKEAYANWLENNKQGIFAMATGTGKTITALNCLLEQFKEEEKYQAIILVPSMALVNQWEAEVESFNFKKIYLVSSRNSQWRSELSELSFSLSINPDFSFIIISTYQTFSGKDFQQRIKKFPSNTLLIADEAHNMASRQMKKTLPNLFFQKRIALSATPKRQFDEEGNKVLEQFFNSSEPYTYVFSMGRAIREGVLCGYEYFPYIVYLNADEMEEYIRITKKLMKYLNHETGGYYDHPEVEILLLARKRIVHKAKGKKAAFKESLKAHLDRHGTLDYSLVYAPEGSDIDENENSEEFSQEPTLIAEYTNIIREVDNTVRAYPFTGSENHRERIALLEMFRSAECAALVSMKCLDEGVDVPRAQNAFFCSSTGNPRQFIQRRGRVLRKHPEKTKAYIYDLIVLPIEVDEEDNYKNIERKLVRDELQRVAYFSSLADNPFYARDVLEPVATQYGLDLLALESELGD